MTGVDSRRGGLDSERMAVEGSKVCGRLRMVFSPVAGVVLHNRHRSTQLVHREVLSLRTKGGGRRVLHPV